jgi:hypothetical protein
MACVHFGTAVQELAGFLGHVSMFHIGVVGTLNPLVFAPSFSPKKVYCHLSDCFGASWCIHHFDRNSDLKYYNVVSPKPKAAYHFTFTQIYHRVEGNINHTQNGGCDIGFIIPSLESPNPRANHCFSIELPFGKHPVHFQTHHIQPYGSCKPSYNGNWV